MDYLLHKANGTDTAELNKQVGGFSAISSVLVKLNHNKVGEMELKLSAPAYTIAIGDWVEAKGKRFYCLNNWKEYIPGEFSVTLLTVEGFGLTSNFYHCTESFDTVYSWSRDNNKVDTGSLKTFGEFFCYNVNYQQNTRLFKLGSFPEGMDTDYRVLSFTNENALSCLYEFCTAYGVRYEFVLNEDEDSLYILNFYAEDVVYPETFSYEKQGGLYELNISNADGQVYTEFVVLGSEDNLPADYPHTELHLPDDYPLSMVKYPDKYATWGRSVKELRLDVKPSRVGSVTAEVSGDLNSFIDSDLISALWSPVGGTIHIVEGPLLGFEFNVSDFNSDTGKVTVEQNTENAITLPEAEYYKFTEGTKYTITGIPLPESYLTTAEENLLSESEPHRLYWSDSRYDARIRVKPKFLETNGEIEAGMLLPVVHEAINLNRNFRVQSITYDPRCEQYYDVTEITISDFRQESIADSQHKAIRTALHRLDDADKAANGIKTVIKNLDTYIDGAFADGLVSEAEAKAIEKYINIVNSKKSDIDAQFTALYANSYLSGTAKTNLNSAKEALNTATTNLLSSINTAIGDGSATTEEKADVDSKFTAFNSAISTYQTRVEEAQEAIHAAAAKAYTDGQLSDYAEVVTGSLGDLQNQIDGNITTWFYAYVPTLSNTPASDWTTTETKNQHLGDLFYDTETGYCYRFQLSGETYSWVKITDTDVTKALADAAAAQDTADNKRRVFVATPTVPYDVGDLWSGGITGDLKRCKTAKATGTYSADDWELASKYTDDSALTTFVSETYTSAISGLQGQIDGKIETYYTDTDPNTWLEADRLKHTGDMWYNTTLKLLKRYNGTSNAWETIEDNKAIEAYNNASNAQDTADGKRRVFTTTPTTPYEVGDLWTGGPIGDLKKCKVERLTGAYNASDWELASKYTDDTEAINAKRDAVNTAKEQADATYTKVYANAYLSGDPKANLNTAKTAFDTAVSELLSALSTGTDVENKIFAYDSATSTLYSKIQDAQEAISSAIKSASESAAKSYALAQDILLKEKTDAYADGVATAAEEAAIEAAQLKVDAAKVLMEAYADGVVSDEEAERIADAQAKYEAALNYADSLASDSSDETDTKVAAAKNALATKFGYTDWAAMEAAVSLISGMTTSAGLINANVIDVTTLAALDAFIEELVVIKLETAVDEDGTKVRIDADAVDGRAGVLLEESTGDKGIKLYYKDSSGVPVFNMYSVSTGELLEFLANRMKFSKGSTKDITIDSDSTILQLRSSTNYAQITPSTLRVDGLATAPVGTGHFWVDTGTGIVHWGIVTPPTVTYSFDIQETYPSGRSDIAASGGTATFTVKLITTTNGTPDAGVLVDLDTGYPSVTSSPTGTSFSITRTGTGTYSITAASRGVVEDSGTAAVISVKYTPSGATQQSTSFNILQEANNKTKTGSDTGVTLSISTIYDDYDCAASGDTWTVTASGESGGREEYTYTSGASGWVSLGGTPITASLISITTSGTGLSGSGTGAGTSVTWADRGTITGERRSGTITASYSVESESVTVYQGHNEIESTSNHVIESVSLNGVNGNVEVDADATYIDPDVRLSYTETYTSGATYDYESYFNDVNYCGKSVSGTGFSIYGNRVNITENTGSSTRNGTLTITYKDATPVQRTITQAAASATTYQILGEIAYSSGSQIPASGGTATLTVTKQTYINGVHQSASDVLIDCDSGYPDLVSQPTGCDVTITRTTTGTYSVSAESRGTTVNSGTDIAIDLQATISGSLKTDSVIVIQQANALASSTGYTITSVTLDGVNDDIDITKSAQTITVLGSGTYTKTYTSGASESANFNLGASDISVSGTGFSYSNFTISVAANSGAERTCTVTASYSGATNVTRTITQAMGIVAPSLSLDTHSLSGNTLTLKASVSSAGGGTITACGFERGNTSSLGTNVSASTVQSGQFTADVSVVAGRTIYWRAYATNEAGTTYTTITNYKHSGTPIEE